MTRATMGQSIHLLAAAAAIGAVAGIGTARDLMPPESFGCLMVAWGALTFAGYLAMLRTFGAWRIEDAR